MRRATALKSIDENLDLSNGLTLTAYQQAISNVTPKLADYNRAAANLAAKQARGRAPALQTTLELRVTAPPGLSRASNATRRFRRMSNDARMRRYGAAGA
jgi:hypothetical protein